MVNKLLQIVFLLILFSASSQANIFKFELLPSPENCEKNKGIYSHAGDINNNGVVVQTTSCYLNSGKFVEISSIYDSGKLKIIPYLDDSRPYSEARAINDDGVIVGSAATSRYTTAFIYSNGELKEIERLAGSYNSYMSDINSDGLAIGASNSPDGVRVFFYENGVQTEFELPDELGLYPSSVGITQDGTVIGRAGYYGPGPSAIGYIYSEDELQLININSSPQTSQISGFNDVGDIVGSLGTSFGTRPYIYNYFSEELRTIEELLPGDLLAYDPAINNSGVVVGSSSNNSPDNLVQRGFYLDPVDGLFDLSDLVISMPKDFYMSSNFSISNSGYISGSGHFADANGKFDPWNSNSFAFLLSPIEVPSPSTFLIFLTTLTGIIFYRMLKSNSVPLHAFKSRH